MSAFRKRVDGSVVVPKRMNGTKPWIYGQTLISSGSDYLNKILNGGYLLGSIGLIEEDMYLNQRETLIRLNLAEANTFEQNIMVISSKTKLNMNDFYTQLPSVLESKQNQSNDDKLASKLVEQKGNLSALQIAYQYKRYLNTNNLGYQPKTQQTYNNNYDLGKLQTINIQESKSSIHLFTLNDILQDGISEGFESNLYDYIHYNYCPFLQNILIELKHFIDQCQSENKVGRIVFDNFMDLKWQQYIPETQTLYMFMNDIKLLLRSTSCFLLISSVYINTKDSSMYTMNLSNIMKFNSDLIMTIEPWPNNEPPEEFKNTIGLFRLLKLPNLLSLYTPLCIVTIYGIERSLRSIKISELHLPPADALSEEDKKKLQSVNQQAIGCSGNLRY